MKLDKRRKYFMILDCETATLPFASEYKEEEVKKRIAIAKPLIYDLGWTIVDYAGNIYKKQNFLISEIFSVPSIFNTAYYKEKRPIYIDKLNRNLISITDWRSAEKELLSDIEQVEAVGAYNAMFDFKKAIPFTSLYISKLYSENFHSWYDGQKYICNNIAKKIVNENTRNFEPDIFRFRGKETKLFDLWGLSCRHLLNNDEYKKKCLQNEWKTASGKYFKTSAETTFRFCENYENFEEAHTAIDDAEIETKIFAKVVKVTKKKFEIGIIYFPFRELGTVENFIEKFGF